MVRRGIAWLALPAIVLMMACSAWASPLVAAPTISRIAPASGIQGATITITGHHLTGATVWFNGIRSPRVKVNASGTKLTAVIPQGAAAAYPPGEGSKVDVATKGGKASSTRFAVLVSP
jgi:IPT/TIG domain-containing protein